MRSHSAGDKNNIASLTKHCRLFQFQLERTRDDTNNFILCMPVTGVRQIHILPYHNFGQGKYEGLNRDYPMGDTEKPSNEQMKAFQEMIQKIHHYTVRLVVNGMKSGYTMLWYTRFFM